MLVECINDQNWDTKVLQYIKEFPVKGDVYTVVKRNHTPHGIGYVLAELNNPPLPPDNAPVGFSAKRFKIVNEDDIDLTEIKEILEEPITA